MKFPLDIYSKRFTACVIICLCNKWLLQHQRNPYAIDVDRRENRNCYACGRFRHLARNCRNRVTGMNQRMEVDQDNINLNGEEGLESPN